MQGNKPQAHGITPQNLHGISCDTEGMKLAQSRIVQVFEKRRVVIKYYVPIV